VLSVQCRGTEAEVTEAPDPTPPADEVVVEVAACGLCGSDVHTLQNGLAEPGQILGHEFSGRIAAVGRDVAGWREGQPVAASPLGSCGKCRICARGLPFRCLAVPNIGITRPGAYAEFVAVPARQLVALPDGVPVELGCHAEPFSVALQAVSLSGAGHGDPVLVYGTGPIGLYAIMALKLAGAGPIVAVGRSPGRRAAAADIGGDEVVTDAGGQRDKRFAAVLECSAAPGAFGFCLSVLEPGGTLVEVALSGEAASLPLFPLVGEGIRVAGCCAFSDETYRGAVGHLVNGRVPAARLISERVPLEGLPSALERLRSPGELVRVLMTP
jgi:(R,R)-butanediol dehydrogenase/meso-butanediol dehydrogenase/diacetyl reductase